MLAIVFRLRSSGRASDTLSLREVEELLAERGLQISYETVRRWVQKFGPMYAHNLRRLRLRPSDTWYLDETVVWFQGPELGLTDDWQHMIDSTTVRGHSLRGYESYGIWLYELLSGSARGRKWNVSY